MKVPRIKADRAYLTIERYAEFTGLHKNTVRNHIKQGYINYYQPKKRGRILIEITNDKTNDKTNSYVELADRLKQKQAV
ncbi:helix-turn-helix domain-containing protein [Petroclostridium sp. X23]|uniref:helix-turn-helix domain-containing protein n=1 Tax=Petroclostridium sp. X23 TaxID=3045146 RepID=UPI0024AD992E|nr:helix-turn-helix domain-containing protein [Petroclostridium sp. X23]WHH58446.1 helix-turn-helix domain-containing protein [Petroclostridium sp. X23]